MKINFGDTDPANFIIVCKDNKCINCKSPIKTVKDRDFTSSFLFAHKSFKETENIKEISFKIYPIENKNL